MDLSSVLELQQHLRVVHHVPGRIRIKFKSDLVNLLRDKDILNKLSGLAKANTKGHLKTLLKAGNPLSFHKPIPGVESIRLNLAARSVIIRYDQEFFHPDWVCELFTTRRAERLQTVINEFKEKLNMEYRYN